MLALQAVTPERLATAVPAITLAEARKLIAQVHRGEPIAPTSAIRRVAAEAVRAVGSVPALDVIAETPSQLDPFVKYLLAAPDGARFEAVRIPLEHPDRVTVCVSSQVGCALACAFCATGRMGLSRNLETWEIVEQVRRIRADLAEIPGARVHGVLFQGMGEALANADRVIQAIRVLGDPSALAIDLRNVTVCTAGLPSGIRRLYREVPAVRLGVSIGAVRGDERKRLMPIDRAHPLAEVLEAAGEHAKATRMAPMFAYTLLEGDNDEPADAEALAGLVRGFEERHGVRPRLSLIPYNRIGDDRFRRSAADRLEAFRAELRARGVGSILRYSGGGDVGAACGQLARSA